VTGDSEPIPRVFSSVEADRWTADQSGAERRYVLSDSTAERLQQALTGMFSTEAQSGPIHGRSVLVHGAYGSGKTLTARLLCAALDPRADVKTDVATRAFGEGPLGECLKRLRRDARPLVAWCSLLETRAGSLQEQVAREVASTLGFCSRSLWVAEAEARLERRGLLGELESAAERHLQTPWRELQVGPQPEEDFARVLRAMPESALVPAGLARHRTAPAPARRFAVKEAVDLVRAMMALRAPGSTLVLALDDTQKLERDDALRDEARLLTSRLAQSFRGRLHILSTRETHASTSPPAQKVVGHGWTVHLGAASIRRTLATLLGDMQTAPALFGDGTEPVFEVALSITTALSMRHAEAAGHAEAMRRTEGKPDIAPPRLVEHIEHLAGRLDAPTATTPSPAGIIELASPAGPWLDPEVSRAIERADELAPRERDVLRAVALLELLPTDTRRTAELVERCIAVANAAEHSDVVRRALDDLSDSGALTHSRLHGYKVQTETGRSWLHMRERIDVTTEETSEIVKEKLALLLLNAAPPVVPDRTLAWRAKYADGKRAHDDPLFDRGDGDPITIDLRHMPLDRRSTEEWERRSMRGPLFHRLIWIAMGDVELVRDLSVDLGRARRMIARFAPVGTPLTAEHQRLLCVERDRAEELGARMMSAVEETFVAGTFYFRGVGTKASDLGTRFSAVLPAAAERVLAELLGIADRVTGASTDEAHVAVVTLPTGREIANPAELDRLLEQIDERVRPLLNRGVKVRLR